VTREEFVALRRSAKEVAEDIRYASDRNCHQDVVTFGPVPVENPLGIHVLLRGSYNRRLKSVSFNFTVEGEPGSICRVDVSGAIHKDAGRTHKHEMRSEADQRNDLPYAVPRPDLEGMTLRQVWDTLCQQAKIDHSGTFVDPS
jgi:hypothetical protein